MDPNISTGLEIVPVTPAVTSPLDISSEVAGVFPPFHALPGPRRFLAQGDVPCCVSCAIAAASESANPGWQPLSPLFHYFVTRTEVLGASPSQAVDLPLPEAKTAMERSGICLDSLHHPPLDSTGMAIAPSAAARADALGRSLPPVSVFPPVDRIVLLSDQNRVVEWKKALLTGRPILAGIDLPGNYSRSMTHASISDGRLGPSHAVMILGYRESEHAFIVHDSRGSDWFLGGQWWMPYAFVESGFVIQAYSFRFH